MEALLTLNACKNLIRALEQNNFLDATTYSYTILSNGNIAGDTGNNSRRMICIFLQDKIRLQTIRIAINQLELFDPLRVNLEHILRLCDLTVSFGYGYYDSESDEDEWF